jgi:D-sedoheptulose 7-phosphate isomerase
VKGHQREEVRIVRIDDELAAHSAALSESVTSLGPTVDDLTECLCGCFERGNKLLLCGNGGSAADAQHIAAEFVNRLCFDRPALPAISLATDTSILTCIANDVSYDQVFARQVAALGRSGDVLAGISTSGRSPNVLAALRTAREAGIVTVGFTGEGGADMADLCDYLIAVSSVECARIQECHSFLWHYVAAAVERQMYGDACG